MLAFVTMINTALVLAQGAPGQSAETNLGATKGLALDALIKCAIGRFRVCENPG